MIEQYAFGKIVVNGITYTDDIKIIKGRVVPDWWRKSGHQVGINDVKDILDSGTGILVIGTGEYGLVKLTASLREHLEDCGIKLIEQNTPESIHIFNRLHTKGRNVSAGFHLTC